MSFLSFSARYTGRSFYPSLTVGHQLHVLYISPDSQINTIMFESFVTSLGSLLQPHKA